MRTNPLLASNSSAIQAFEPEKQEKVEKKKERTSNCCGGCWRGIASAISSKFRGIVQTQEGEAESAEAEVNPWDLLREAYSQNAKQAPFKESITVFLVDDNRTNLMVWKRSVQRYRCTVTTVGDGADAVEEVRKSASNPFDVIILDEEMPKMKGSTAAKTIREWVNRNVLILSCSSLGEEIGERNVEYFDGFLPKGVAGFHSALEHSLLKRHPLLKRQIEPMDIE